MDFEDSSDDDEPTRHQHPSEKSKVVIGDDDDDDSDEFEDEEVEAETKTEITAPDKEYNRKNDDEKDDAKEKASQESDDKQSEARAKASEAAPEEKTTTMNSLFDDSDDSDEDDAAASFDDVVGASAPSKPKKLPTSAPTSTLSDDDLGDDVDGQREEGSPSKSRRPKKKVRPTQNAAILHADRPASGVSLHMTKLPNLVGIQTAPFDPYDFDEKEEEEQYNGYVHNMIRWRYKRDEKGSLVRSETGQLERESNTKMVKWSDGSYTLHIGNESFDIQTIDSSKNGFPGLNGFVYLSQKAHFKKSEKSGGEEKDGEEDDGYDDPSQKAGTGTVLECIGPVASRLVAKPSSLQSEAHKSLTVAVRQRTIKKARIAEHVTEEDPEKAKQERIRTNTDADKQRQRRRAQGGGGGGYRAGGGRRPGMNRGYLEASDDEQYDSINIRALKKGTANYEDEMDDYGDDDSDDDYGTFAKRGRKRPRKEEKESDEDEREMVFDDDDDEEVPMHQKKKAQSTNAAVFDDDEE
jgi:RNA polymerase-associated protein LEO1